MFLFCINLCVYNVRVRVWGGCEGGGSEGGCEEGGREGGCEGGGGWGGCEGGGR